jgi:hypothetical protein
VHLLFVYCYCLGNFPDGLDKLTANWKDRNHERDIKRAIEIPREKFASVESFGPGQVVEFLDLQDVDAREMHARRAFELVQKFLSLL